MVVSKYKYLSVAIETQTRARYREVKTPRPPHVLHTSSSFLLYSHGPPLDPPFTNEQRPHRGEDLRGHGCGGGLGLCLGLRFGLQLGLQLRLRPL